MSGSGPSAPAVRAKPPASTQAPGTLSLPMQAEVAEEAAGVILEVGSDLGVVVQRLIPIGRSSSADPIPESKSSWGDM